MSETTARRRSTGRKSSGYASQPDTSTIVRVVGIQPEGKNVEAKYANKIYAAVAAACGKDVKSLTSKDIQESGLQYCVCETIVEQKDRTGETIPPHTQFIMVVPRADRNRLPENMVNPENGKEINVGSLITIEGASFNITPDNTLVAAVQRCFAGPLPAEQFGVKPDRVHEYGKLFIEREEANEPLPTPEELAETGFEPQPTVALATNDKWAMCFNRPFHPQDSNRKASQAVTMVALSSDVGATQKLETFDDLRAIVGALLEKRKVENADGRRSPLGNIGIIGSFCNRDDDPANAANRVGFNMGLYVEPTEEWTQAHPGEVFEPSVDEVIAHAEAVSRKDETTFFELVEGLKENTAYGVAAESRYISCMPTIAEQDYTTRVTDPSTGEDDIEYDGRDNRIFEQGFSINNGSNRIVLLTQTRLTCYNTPKEGQEPDYANTQVGWPATKRGALMQTEHNYYTKPVVLSVQQSSNLDYRLSILKGVLNYLGEKVTPGMTPEKLAETRSAAYKAAMSGALRTIAGPNCWSADLPIDVSPFLGNALQTNSELSSAYSQACRTLSERIDALAPLEKKKTAENTHSASPSGPSM